MFEEDEEEGGEIEGFMVGSLFGVDFSFRQELLKHPLDPSVPNTGPGKNMQRKESDGALTSWTDGIDASHDRERENVGGGGFLRCKDPDLSPVQDKA